MQILSISELAIAVEFLRQDEPVAFPTETVYGLGAPIFSDKAIRKVFSVKNRPADNPLIAHVANMNDVERIAINIPEEFYQLAKAFWPGSLSILLEAYPDVPLVARGGLSTIAVRMPAHPIALALIEAMGQPLVAPSANISGRPSSTCVRHVIEDFDGKIAAVLDGGACEGGLESTVISLNHENGPAVLRPGSITCDDLARVLGRPVSIAKEDRPLCPGMKYRHYAPKAHLRLFFEEAALKQYQDARPSQHSMLLRRSDNTLSAQQFYASLRKADQENISEIIIYCDEETRQNAAFFNRILKASGNPT